MSELKHTPVPWEAYKSWSKKLEIHGNERVVDGEEISDVIAENVSEANAKLIAAAPELLEALIACDEAMEYISEYDIPITLPQQVKVAIAKATGE